MCPQTALLARPHPVIVDAMRDVVAASGLKPRALSSREELLAWPTMDVALVVVSTSVHSTVEASFEDVIRAARQAHPTAALVIGTVVEAGHARRLLTDMLLAYGVEGRLRTARELVDSANDALDGRDILLVNRHELAQADSRAWVERAIARLVAAPPPASASVALPRRQAPDRVRH